jgi:hypothetical protein
VQAVHTHTHTHKHQEEEALDKKFENPIEKVIRKRCHFGRAWISWMRKVDLIHEDMY